MEFNALLQAQVGSDTGVATENVDKSGWRSAVLFAYSWVALTPWNAVTLEKWSRKLSEVSTRYFQANYW